MKLLAQYIEPTVSNYTLKENKGDPKKQYQEYLAWIQGQGVLCCSDAKT